MSNMKIKTNNLFFYVGYLSILFSFMFSKVYIISKGYKTFQNVAIVLLTLNILIQSKKYTRKQFMIIYLLTIVLFISYYFTKSNALILVWLLITSSKNIKIKEFCKYDLIFRTLFLCIVVCLYFMGFTENYFMYRNNGMLRSSMGLSHPNDFGAYMMILCLEYFYIKQKKLKLLDYSFLLLSLLLMRHFSDSRTSEICIILFFTILIFNKVSKYKLFENKNFQFIIKYIFIILFLLILGMSLLYKNNSRIAIIANNVFSNRIRLSSYTLENYKVKLFGNNIKFVTTKEALLTGKKAFILDNSYMHILMVYGVIVFIVFAYASYLLNKKMLIEKQYLLLSIFIVLYFYGFNETGLFKIQFNSFLICFSYILYNKKFDKENNSILSSKSIERDNENGI